MFYIIPRAFYFMATNSRHTTLWRDESFAFSGVKRALATIFPFIFSILGAARAATSPITDEQLRPILDWSALLLNKNINTLDILYLVVLLGFFTGVIIYFGLKKSGVFGESFIGTNFEAALAGIITILVLRFMPVDYFLVILLVMLVLAAIISVFTLLSIGRGVLGQRTITPAVTLIIAGFVLQSIPGFITSIIKNTGIPQKGISDIIGYVGMLVPLGWLFIIIGFVSVIWGVKRLFTGGRNAIGNFRASRRERADEKATRTLERRQRGSSPQQRQRTTAQEINIETSQFYDEVKEAKRLHQTAQTLAKTNPQKARLAKEAERLVRNLEILSRNEMILLRNREKRLARQKSTVDIDKKIGKLNSVILTYQNKKDNLERALNKSAGARTRPRKLKSRVRDKARAKPIKRRRR